MASTERFKKFGEDLDEALDLLDDLTEEELAALEADFDPNDELCAAPERRREDQKERMYHKRDMVEKLENVFTQNASRGKMANRIEPIKPWQKPEIPNYSKINKTEFGPTYSKSNNNNAKHDKTLTDDKRTNQSAVVTLTAEEEDLLSDLTEEDLLEFAALSGTHGLLTQEQITAFERGGLDDKEWSSLGMNGKSIEPVKEYKQNRVMSMSDEDVDLDGPLLLHHLNEDNDEVFYVRINNVPLETTLLHSIFEALKITKKIKHISLAGVGLKDEDGLILNAALKDNKTLESVNLESNELTNDSLMPLFKILESHPTIREFKCSHQKHGLGSRGEEAMARALKKNNRLLKISYPFQVPSARSIADRCQIRNNEILRQNRNKGNEYYNYREEIAKRDKHPQPWIKNYKNEKHEQLRKDLNDQKLKMNKVENIPRMRADAKLRAKENAKPTVDDELADKLTAAKKSGGRSIR